MSERHPLAKAVSCWAWPVCAFLLPLVLVVAHKGTIVLMSVMLLTGGLHFWLTRSWRSAIDRRVVIAGLAFLAWGGASMLWETTPGLALHRFVQLFALGIAATVVLSFTMDHKASTGDNRTARAFILGLALALAYITLEWLTQCGISTTVGKLFSEEPRCVVPRYKTMMTSVAFLAVPMLCRLMFLPDWRSKLSGGGLLLAFTGLTLVTKGSSALIAVPVGIVVFVAVYWTPRVTTLAMVAITMLVLLSAPTITRLLPTPSQAYEFGLPNSMYHRLLIWGFVADRIDEKPFLGWGLDASREIPGGEENGIIIINNFEGHRLELEQQLLPLHPHNFALQIHLEAGMIGAILIAALLATILLVAYRPMDRLERAGRVAAFAIWVSVSGASYGIWQSWWLSAILLMVGVLAHTPRAESKP